MANCLRCGNEFTQNVRSTPQLYCTEYCRKKEERRRWKARGAPIRAARYAAYLAENEPKWAASRAARLAARRWVRRSLADWVEKAVWWPSGCLLWVGPVDAYGYPRVNIGGKHTRVTRLICGIDDDRCALHTCDVPECINPDHLYAGTAKDNTADMVRRGRAHMKKDVVSGRFA